MNAPHAALGGLEGTSGHSSIVIAGLDPAIHGWPEQVHT
jgi:hypothetical protein